MSALYESYKSTLLYSNALFLLISALLFSFSIAMMYQSGFFDVLLGQTIIISNDSWRLIGNY